MVTPQPYTVKARNHPFATAAARGAGQNGRDLRRRLSTTGRRSRVSMNRRFGRGCLGIRMPRTDTGRRAHVSGFATADLSGADVLLRDEGERDALRVRHTEWSRITLGGMTGCWRWSRAADVAS